MAVVQGRLGAFAAILAESQSQRAMIEQLYQDLARHRDAEISIELPTLNESLAAIRTFRLGRDGR